MLIRRATDADVGALFALRAEVGDYLVTSLDPSASGRAASSIVGMLGGSSDAGWIALEQERCVGFCIARSSSGDIYMLFVHPNATRRGVGTRLLSEAENWLYGEGVRRAWVRARGRAALHLVDFYRKRGWRKIGNHANSSVLYTKSLTPAPAIEES